MDTTQGRPDGTTGQGGRPTRRRRRARAAGTAALTAWAVLPAAGLLPGEAAALAGRPGAVLQPAARTTTDPAAAAAPAAPGDPGGDGEGEQDGTGPKNAHVPPEWANPAAARATVRRIRPHPGPPPHPAPDQAAPDQSAPDQAAPDHAAHDHTAHLSAPADAADAVLAEDPLDPAVYGSWETLSYKLPVRAVHATALRTGKFLLIAGSGNTSKDNVIGAFNAYLWDPATGALTSIPVPYDAFCSSHLVDANGDVLVFGGTTKYSDTTAGTPWVGSQKVVKYVVATGKWEAMPSMSKGRWYPTAVLDGSGRALLYSGLDVNGVRTTTPERYDPATKTWTVLPGRDLPLYPGLLLLEDGRVAYTGAHYGSSTIATKMWDPSTGAKTAVGGAASVLDLAHRNMAMSAFVGSADQQLAWVAGGGFPAVKSTYFTDYDASATPAAVAGPALPAAKAYVSVSGLPDLTALETGGGTGTASPVYEASILDPKTRTLLPVAPPNVPRTYHSSSLTMADGRVVTFGGDPGGAANFELRVEIYSPPYLFKGARPSITSAPGSVTRGSTYTLGTSGASPVTYASLLRPGSATHSVDANQRGLKLTTTAVTGGVKVVVPGDREHVPPGWYTLQVVDGQGRPSVGRWVKVG